MFRSRSREHRNPALPVLDFSQSAETLEDNREGFARPMQPTVAIVDDEEGLREAVVEYLGNQGLRTLSAEHAQAFRRLIETERIDVVVLDIAMPGEDGLSLARWLREQHTIGIILATAAGRQIDRIVGLEIGADDYIVKPYDLRELLARIRSILRRVKSPTVAKPAEVAAAAPA